MKFPSWIVIAYAISTTANAQPAGYHVGAPVVHSDSLIEVRAGGRFRASILRTAANANDARLIRLAEELYPSPEAIVASSSTVEERNKLLATAAGASLRKLKVSQRPAGTPADRWWLDSFDETWIPFAVTGGAIDYYLGRLHDYAAGLSPFGFRANGGADNGALFYTAKVLPTSEPGASRVVELKVQWSYWCGNLCAMEFVHTRRVFFDAAGQAMRIDGDGRPTVIVS